MKKIRIKNIKARQILNSKGSFAVEVDLETEEGVFSASVPSGTSKGKQEAEEKEPKEAIKNIENIIFPELRDKSFSSQKEIDKTLIDLDGTEKKSHLGANAILAVSVAFCRAAAALQEVSLWKHISGVARTKPSLPTPAILLVEGGMHAGNALDVQEFMIVLQGNSFAEKLKKGVKIYQILKKNLREKYGEFATNVGYEGGFAAPFGSTPDALNFITKSIKEAHYSKETKVILDVAATSFFSDGNYKLEGITFTKKGFFNFYSDIIKKYSIVAIEDPFAEDDWGGFQEMTKRFGKEITIIGDDLLTTNPDRIKKAVDKKYCNGLIVKPNQIGTVTEAIEAAKLGLDNKWQVFVKHRSGETCDDFIADFAVGLGTGWIMTGAPTRGERTSKYNRLLRIEEEIN